MLVNIALIKNPSGREATWRQIVPTAMNEMMKNASPKQLARVIEAFLKMKN